MAKKKVVKSSVRYPVKKSVRNLDNVSLDELSAEKAKRKFEAQYSPSEFVSEVAPDTPKQIPYAGGLALSSLVPPLHLIPTVALESLANRFQLGIERKGNKSWNAISQNQEILTDREFAIERISHIIHHATKLRDKLIRGDEIPGEDDDAGAILWGGAFLACVAEVLKMKGNL